MGDYLYFTSLYGLAAFGFGRRSFSPERFGAQPASHHTELNELGAIGTSHDHPNLSYFSSAAPPKIQMDQALANVFSVAAYSVRGLSFRIAGDRFPNPHVTRKIFRRVLGDGEDGEKIESMISDLIKYVYLLDIDGIRNSIDDLWFEYQKILDDPGADWEDINRARANLYFLGHIFAEQIVPESLEKRLKFIRPEITLTNFLIAIDGNDQKILVRYKNNKKFQEIRNLYLATKEIKMRVRRKGDELYLDEKRFNEKYEKLKPRNYF